MATPLQGTQSGAVALKRVHWQHDTLIDMMLARPEASQDDFAKELGYTPAWLSRIICSDAFQARLAERKTELVDPLIRADIEQKLKFAAHKSLDIIQERMENMPVGGARTELALEVLKITPKALGFGARERGASGGIVQNFVVQLPAKVEDQQKWVEQARGGAISDAIVKEASHG
jgi:hypothetical protein